MRSEKLRLPDEFYESMFQELLQKHGLTASDGISIEDSDPFTRFMRT
jgi:hypothetical protein